MTAKASSAASRMRSLVEEDACDLGVIDASKHLHTYRIYLQMAGVSQDDLTDSFPFSGVIHRSESLYIAGIIDIRFLMPSEKYILKLCLLGDGAVGKTSLVRRFVFDVFDDKYIMSFGTKVSKKVIRVDESEIDLMIWDILGQRMLESLHAAYYRGAVGAFAVCDFTRPETMSNLRNWIGSFKAVVGEQPVIVLGNKMDLERKFSLEELQAFGGSVGCLALETSAKTGTNVERAFSEMGRMMLGAK